MSEERTDEFFEEFGRQVIKLFKWNNKKFPAPKAMKESAYGLQMIGKMSYKQMEKKGYSTDFEMLCTMTESTLENVIKP